jgi:hypothetical protein
MYQFYIKRIGGHFFEFFGSRYDTADSQIPNQIVVVES